MCGVPYVAIIWVGRIEAPRTKALHEAPYKALRTEALHEALYTEALYKSFVQSFV